MRAISRGFLFSVVMVAEIGAPAWAVVPAAVRQQQPEIAAASSPVPKVFGGSAFADDVSAGSNLRKLDGSLRQFAVAAPSLKAATAAAQLSTINPLARLRTRAPLLMPQVMIDAIADGEPGDLKAALEKLGMENISSFSNDVGGWFPADQLQAAAALPQLRLARIPHSRTRAGAVTTQGDFVQGSTAVRALSNGFDGTGVTVGVLSNSFNCYAYYQRTGLSPSGDQGFASNGFNVNAAMDISTGDITGSVNVLSEADCGGYDPTMLPYSDEGRSILQIIHDVAPGASLAFYAAPDTEANFANGILALANAGAKVIDDDIGYIDEPFFQDGVISQAIDQVTARGVAYYTSAGNDGQNAYDNLAPSFPVTAAAGTQNAGEQLLNFDTSGSSTTTTLPVSIPTLSPGTFIYFVLEWDQPYVSGAPGSPGSANALDLCMTDSTGAVQMCSGANTVGGDPVDYLIYGNPANSGMSTQPVNIELVVGLAQGAAPKRLKLLVLDDGLGAEIKSFQTNSPTLQGHAGAAGAASVGAAFFFNTPRCGKSPAVLEDFSSTGGTPILFDTSGNRLATPVVRNKPDFVGPDGVNNTFLGYQYQDPFPTSITQCQDDNNYPSFFGTSAAAPHVAAAATLFLQAKSTLTPSQIKAAFSATAAPMSSGTGYSYDSGAGFVRVDSAFSQLGLTPPSVPPGSGTTNGTTTGGTGTGTASPPHTDGGGSGGSIGLLELAMFGLVAMRRRSRR